MTVATRSLPSGQNKRQTQLTERKLLFNLTTERGARLRFGEYRTFRVMPEHGVWSNTQGLTSQGARAHNRGLARFFGLMTLFCGVSGQHW
jgi:hypothetical protein